MNSLTVAETQVASKSWYLVWSEARAEGKVAERLLSRGFDVWLPTLTERRRWSDRWKVVTRPLFPGYLFVCGEDGEGYPALLRTPGVLTLVKEGGKPVRLSPAYVSDLRRIVEDRELKVEQVEERAPISAGDEVIVRDGPLAGFRGWVVERRGPRRLIVWIASIGRGFSCTIGDAFVMKSVEVSDLGPETRQSSLELGRF